MDTIVVHCTDRKALETQTGVITARPTLSERYPWNTVTQTLVQVNLMTEGGFGEIGGTELLLNFPIVQLSVPLVQKTVVGLTVNWTH